ncbi:hypothetical protein Pelo_7619 [Pelomyxa schiedti]|nr:hypothetical protein Pelo_7619 [Pelomyxa schiedti]
MGVVSVMALICKVDHQLTTLIEKLRSSMGEGYTMENRVAVAQLFTLDSVTKQPNNLSDTTLLVNYTVIDSNSVIPIEHALYTGNSKVILLYTS